MSRRFGNVQHIVRVATIFAAGFLLFVIVRAGLVPADFGVDGFYRAGARVEAMGLPLSYSEDATCAVCHSEVDDLRKTARHATVKCEACHGPNWKHAEDPDVKPAALDSGTLCLGCHTRSAGKPAKFPQVIKTEHEPGRGCTECHRPHHPKIERGKELRR